MKVLVITPTLGRSRWLSETVDSVAALSLPIIHVLVAPGAVSVDLQRKFPNTEVISEAGSGMYGAVNDGARHCKSWDAITYINDDDLLLPAFNRLARAAKERGRAEQITYGRVSLVDGAGRRLGSIPINPWPTLSRSLYRLRIEPVYQQGTLISRAAWDRMGGFCETLRFCGDSEFLARACIKSIPFFFCNRTVGAFRLRTGQLTKNRALMINERFEVDRNLKLVSAPRRLHDKLASLVFRAANAAVYIERIARHGPITFDRMLEKM